MGLFSRRQEAATPDRSEENPAVADPSNEVASEAAIAAESEVAREVGPKALTSHNIDDSYADLGVIKVKPAEGMQVNLPSQQPPFEFITFIIGNAAVQLSVFAVPKNAHGWDERRAQVKEAYRAQGLKVIEAESRYGRDLLVEVEVQSPDGREGTGKIRFSGVSGDRWVAQMGFHGAAVDPDSDSAKQIDQFLDSILVDRGDAPHPPYSPLPINFPLHQA